MVSSPDLTLSPLQCSFSGSLDRNCSCSQSPLRSQPGDHTLPYFLGHRSSLFLGSPLPRPPCSPHSWPCLLGLAPGLLLPAHPGSPSRPPLLTPPLSGLSIGFSPAPLPNPADIKCGVFRPHPALLSAQLLPLCRRSAHNGSRSPRVTQSWEAGMGRGMRLGSREGGEDSRLHPHLPRQVSASNA